MKENILSIIVPVYNVELYLSECLDSILNQGVNEEIELICINDGSLDLSWNLLESYKLNYPNIIIEDQKNIGLGATRNRGITMASGKYIMFVDSDDWLEENSLCQLLEVCKTRNHDFIEYESLVRNPTKEKASNFNTFQLVCAGDKSVEIYLQGNNNLLITAWSKLWSRAFILKHQLKFAVNTRFEDIEFSLPAYSAAKQISNIKLKVYNYRISEQSLTRSGVTDKYLNEFVTQRVKNVAKFKSNTSHISLNRLLELEHTKVILGLCLLVKRGLLERSISAKWGVVAIFQFLCNIRGISRFLIIRYVNE